MNSRHTLFSLLVVAVGLALFAFFRAHHQGQTVSKHSPDPAPKSVPPERATAKQNAPLPKKQIEVPQAQPLESAPLMSRGERNIPTRVPIKKDRLPPPFDGAEKFRIGGTRYSRVTNYYGAMSASTDDAAFRINGISYFERTDAKSPENVIYDHEHQAYGLWTGEVLITGEEEAIIDITKAYDLSLIGGENNNFFLKAGPNFSLAKDVPAVRKTQGVERITLDLRFGKLKRQ